MRLGETVSPLKGFVEGWREQGCKRTHDWNNQVRSKEAGGGGGGSLEGRLLSLVTLHTPSLIRFLYAKGIFPFHRWRNRAGRQDGETAGVGPRESTPLQTPGASSHAGL